MSVNALYQQRFETVLAYIEDNLEGDLSVETLSAVAHFRCFIFTVSSVPMWASRLLVMCN